MSDTYLKAMLELQRSVGELKGTVKALKETVGDHDRKLNRLMFALFVAMGAGAVIIWVLELLGA